MKTKQSFKAIAVTVAVSLAAYGVANSFMVRPVENNNLLMENVEALTEIKEIGTVWYIVDEIPCYSEANEIMIHYSYINCGTCESEMGQGKGNSGSCTKTRKFNP